MSSQRIPVACIQTLAHDRDAFDTHLARTLAQVIVAGERGAKLIVLPEGTVPAYVLGDEPVDPLQIADAQHAFAELARRFAATIVYGTARIVRDRTYNTAAVIGPDGTLLGAPAKHFLWHFDRRWFAAGDRLEPVDTPVGRLGILVCADGRIPTIARTLVERGAQILVMPTAWVTSGRNPHELENVQADLFVNVRAHENAVPFVVANKSGVERASVAYCGKSAIVGSDGITIDRASQDGDAIVFAEVELAAPPEPSSEHLMASALYLQSEVDAADPERPTRARIAFSTEHRPDELSALARIARIAEATHLIASALPRDVPEGLTPHEASAESAETAGSGGLRLEVVSYRRLRDPAALVPARLAGVDLFVCTGFDESDPMGERYVRTRAIELRAYVVALDRRRGRAFACDPDGAIVAGTFGEFRVAAFAYDRARSGATVVAPGTDVLDGLRSADPHYRAALRERYPAFAHAE